MKLPTLCFFQIYSKGKKQWLEAFNYGDLREISDTLESWSKYGLPSTFKNQNVEFFSDDMADVQLTNSDDQFAKLNESTGKIESYYYLGTNELNGFASELYDDFLNDYVEDEDYAELAEILDIEGYHEYAKNVRNAM